MIWLAFIALIEISDAESDELNLPDEISKRSFTHFCKRSVTKEIEETTMEDRSMKTLVVDRCDTGAGMTSPCRRIKRSTVKVPVVRKRQVTEEVEECCSGWKGHNCLTPICDPDCMNGGECKSPNACFCLEGFVGDHCQRKEGTALVVRSAELAQARAMVRRRRDTAAPCEDEGAVENQGCRRCTCQEAAWACDDSECPGMCAVYGDRTYVTFDGMRYEYSGSCSYVVARDCSLAQQFKVTAHMVTVPGSTLSRIGSLEVKYAHQYTLSVKHEMGVFVVTIMRDHDCDDEPETIHLDSSHGIISKNSYGSLSISANEFVVILHTSQFSVSWNGYDALYVYASTEHTGALCGMCGNFDSDPTNDMSDSYGGLTNDAATMAQSWNVDADCSSKEQIPPTCSNSQLETATYDCGLIKDHATDCPNSDDFYAACISAICNCPDEEGRPLTACTCNALSAFFAQCRQTTGKSPDWIPQSICSDHLSCPGGAIYSEMREGCEMTCGNYYLGLGCAHQEEGCFCPEGKVRDARGNCVAVQDCTCTRGDDMFDAGETYTNECKSCTCEYGKWNCKELPCLKHCFISGQGVFRTFDSYLYSHYSECEQTLLTECFANSHEIPDRKSVV